MKSAQVVSLLAQRAHLVTEGGQISLHALVLSLQCLNASQVLAKVVGGQQEVFLVDPADRLVSVTVVPLDIVGTQQLLLPGDGKGL